VDAILLRDVSQSFDKTLALEPLTLSFDPGRTHVILGASGCGKTTLLRIIAGILTPDRGEVWIGETRLTASSQPSLAERMGYVIQEGGLFPHLTAAQNISLKARLIGPSGGWPEQRILVRLQELTEIAGLTRQMLDRYPGELSGGQRQRVSLMRALMLDPPILLLDEPLGALDPIVRHTLQVELRSIFDRLHRTVVLVTHDLNEAVFLGDRVLLLNHGKIIQDGRFQDLFRTPASPYVTEFINAQRPLPPREERPEFAA
jgi:osmoprotectant transport system ATP-binding protein